jgi:hypothetical protein
MKHVTDSIFKLSWAPRKFRQLSCACISCVYSMNQQVLGMMGGLGGLNRFLSELIKVQITSLAPAIFSDPSMQNCRAIAVIKKK